MSLSLRIPTTSNMFCPSIQKPLSWKHSFGECNQLTLNLLVIYSLLRICNLNLICWRNLQLWTSFLYGNSWFKWYVDHQQATLLVFHSAGPTKLIVSGDHSKCTKNSQRLYGKSQQIVLHLTSWHYWQLESSSHTWTKVCKSRDCH